MCENGGVYERLGSACPPTCADLNAPQTCSLPDTEVCSCQHGQVLENGQCVDSSQCGCVLLGVNYGVNIYVLSVVYTLLLENRVGFISNVFSIHS